MSRLAAARIGRDYTASERHISHMTGPDLTRRRPGVDGINKARPAICSRVERTRSLGNITKWTVRPPTATDPA